MLRGIEFRHFIPGIIINIYYTIPVLPDRSEATILADDPTPEQGAVKPDRAIDEHILDSVLLKGIDKSVHDLERHSPTFEHPNVRDARHILIQALQDFRQAYTNWLFPPGYCSGRVVVMDPDTMIALLTYQPMLC